MICITKEYLEMQNFKNFDKYDNDLSKQDIATILEVYSEFMKSYSFEDIDCILKNQEGYFLILLNSNPGCNFDLIEYLNRNYTGNEEINCMNLKLLFPVSLSRGLFQENIEISDSTISEKTGYIDETEILEAMSRVCFLTHLNSNSQIKISSSGVYIGRSNKESEFVVNNSNISRKHCRVFLKGGYPCIRDLNSTNGTFINGRRIEPNIDIMLNDGDSIYLANEEFKLTIG